jgi:phosphoribosylanthranilate isomerase
VKACCISSLAEAALALDAGADALGLVSAMPSGPGVIADSLIAEIAAWVGGRAATVLLTSRQSAEEIAGQIGRARPAVIQICDALTVDDYRALRALVPSTPLMQVIHVQGEASVREASEVAPHVDAILLDSGRPSAAVKELGGTGRRHDWTVSRVIRESVQVPVFLAGGLNPENVGEAIATVRPFGVDVCSGVRRDGRLDATLVQAFIQATRLVA